MIELFPRQCVQCGTYSRSEMDRCQRVVCGVREPRPVIVDRVENRRYGPRRAWPFDEWEMVRCSGAKCVAVVVKSRGPVGRDAGLRRDFAFALVRGRRELREIVRRLL